MKYMLILVFVLFSMSTFGYNTVTDCDSCSDIQKKNKALNYWPTNTPNYVYILDNTHKTVILYKVWKRTIEQNSQITTATKVEMDANLESLIISYSNELDKIKDQLNNQSSFTLNSNIEFSLQYNVNSSGTSPNVCDTKYLNYTGPKYASKDPGLDAFGTQIHSIKREILWAEIKSNIPAIAAIGSMWANIEAAAKGLLNKDLPGIDVYVRYTGGSSVHVKISPSMSGIQIDKSTAQDADCNDIPDPSKITTFGLNNYSLSTLNEFKKYMERIGAKWDSKFRESDFSTLSGCYTDTWCVSRSKGIPICTATLVCP